MIPNSGRRHNLNLEAEFTPAERGEPTVPTVMLGGARVSLYADSNGVFHVSISRSDGDELDPRFARETGSDKVRLTVTIDDDMVLHW